MTTLPATTGNGGAIQKKPEEPAIVQLVRRMGPQIQMALPKHLTPERMVRMALTCIRKTPKLLQCNQQSVLQAIIELSQLGLEPSTPLGHAWIIPYGAEATIMIGYKGFISLADRAGLVLTAECVYEGDFFEFSLGTDQHIAHKPTLGERGKLQYAYAVARWPDGRTTFRIVFPQDIDRAKQSSAAWRAGQQNPNKRDSPWYTDEAAQWRKTAIRRLAPFLPMTAELARAVELDEAEERGVNIVDTHGIDWAGDIVSTTDGLQNRLDAATAGDQQNGTKPIHRACGHTADVSDGKCPGPYCPECEKTKPLADAGKSGDKPTRI